MSKGKINWRDAPNRDEYEAARSYLSLLCPGTTVRRLSTDLSHARTLRATAKDLLRASDLRLLPRDESHVRDDLKRLQKGKALSPVLLVRGEMSRGVPLVIADGYHRVCATCYFDEDASIAYRIASVARMRRR